MAIRKGNIDRRELLAKLFPNPSDWLFVSGLAGASKDTAQLTNDGPNLYSMAGTMGAAVPMGLGLAMSAPERKVGVINGDGEMLMGIGAFVTVASAAPANLVMVCIDNAMHGETGGQSGHTSRTADLEMIAKGSGIDQCLTIAEPGEIAAGAKFIAEGRGPKLLLCRVLPTAPSDFKRNIDPAECRVRFRQAFRAA
jgi:thiamine pyrophosphate-dependent acetolactate synthase large subunit-like protein